MSFLSILKKIGGIGASLGADLIPGGALAKDAVKAGIGVAGSALNGASKASANNRGTTLDALIAQQQLRDAENNSANNANLNRDQLLTEQQKQMQDELIAREQAGEASGNNAIKNLLHTDYIANRTKDYAPPTVTGQGGKQVTLIDPGFGPKASTADVIAGANGLKGEAMNRLQNGNPIAAPGAMPDVAPIATNPQFTLPSNLMKPGTFETIANYLGPALTGLSTFDQLNAKLKPKPLLNADDENYLNGDQG